MGRNLIKCHRILIMEKKEEIDVKEQKGITEENKFPLKPSGQAQSTPHIQSQSQVL